MRARGRVEQLNKINRCINFAADSMRSGSVPPTPEPPTSSPFNRRRRVRVCSSAERVQQCHRFGVTVLRRTTHAMIKLRPRARGTMWNERGVVLCSKRLALPDYQSICRVIDDAKCMQRIHTHIHSMQSRQSRQFAYQFLSEWRTSTREHAAQFRFAYVSRRHRCRRVRR